ncbi:hypothetical protein DFJ73DRAFT_273627 [Zopfochytrium polystomum]|nr:hypothetical protein DFJ73DRAFT_273627 [Zopfochytrium polystomum]
MKQHSTPVSVTFSTQASVVTIDTPEEMFNFSTDDVESSAALHPILNHKSSSSSAEAVDDPLATVLLSDSDELLSSDSQDLKKTRRASKTPSILDEEPPREFYSIEYISAREEEEEENEEEDEQNNGDADAVEIRESTPTETVSVASTTEGGTDDIQATHASEPIATTERPTVQQSPALSTMTDSTKSSSWIGMALHERIGAEIRAGHSLASGSAFEISLGDTSYVIRIEKKAESPPIFSEPTSMEPESTGPNNEGPSGLDLGLREPALFSEKPPTPPKPKHLAGSRNSLSNSASSLSSNPPIPANASLPEEPISTVAALPAPTVSSSEAESSPAPVEYSDSTAASPIQAAAQGGCIDFSPSTLPVEQPPICDSELEHDSNPHAILEPNNEMSTRREPDASPTTSVRSDQSPSIRPPFASCMSFQPQAPSPGPVDAEYAPGRQQLAHATVHAAATRSLSTSGSWLERDMSSSQFETAPSTPPPADDTAISGHFEAALRPSLFVRTGTHPVVADHTAVDSKIPVVALMSTSTLQHARESRGRHQATAPTPSEGIVTPASSSPTSHKSMIPRSRTSSAGSASSPRFAKPAATAPGIPTDAVRSPRTSSPTAVAQKSERERGASQIPRSRTSSIPRPSPISPTSATFSAPSSASSSSSSPASAASEPPRTAPTHAIQQHRAKSPSRTASPAAAAASPARSPRSPVSGTGVVSSSPTKLKPPVPPKRLPTPVRPATVSPRSSKIASLGPALGAARESSKTAPAGATSGLKSPTARGANVTKASAADRPKPPPKPASLSSLNGSSGSLGSPN